MCLAALQHRVRRVAVACAQALAEKWSGGENYEAGDFLEGRLESDGPDATEPLCSDVYRAFGGNYTCTKPAGHDGDHGTGGCTWREIPGATPEPKRYCGVPQPRPGNYACIRDFGHDGQHGYAGMFWPQAAGVGAPYEPVRAAAEEPAEQPCSLCGLSTTNLVNTGDRTLEFVCELCAAALGQTCTCPCVDCSNHAHWRCHGEGVDIDTEQAPAGHPMVELAVAAACDVLAEHAFRFPDHGSIGSNPHCACGLRPDSRAAWDRHVAELIVDQVDDVLIEVVDLVDADTAVDFLASLTKIIEMLQPVDPQPDPLHAMADADQRITQHFRNTTE